MGSVGISYDSVTDQVFPGSHSQKHVQSRKNVPLRWPFSFFFCFQISLSSKSAALISEPDGPLLLSSNPECSAAEDKLESLRTVEALPQAEG